MNPATGKKVWRQSHLIFFDLPKRIQQNSCFQELNDLMFEMISIYNSIKNEKLQKIRLVKFFSSKASGKKRNFKPFVKCKYFFFAIFLCNLFLLMHKYATNWTGEIYFGLLNAHICQIWWWQKNPTDVILSDIDNLFSLSTTPQVIWIAILVSSYLLSPFNCAKDYY